ncbi:MAG TPA: hypothetical protein VK787_16860 [Puia sp.]|jgi:hypothetical protein|nr:hypothetical protein [Puia sp.]
MKSCFLIILVSIFAVQCLNAQKEYSKNSLSFSIGPSIPVGSFAGTNLSNGSSGFAKIGESVNFSFDHRLNQHLVFTVMLSGQINRLNTNALKTQLSEYPFFADFSSIGTRHYSNWVVDKKSWCLESLQMGITEEIPFSNNDNLSFTGKILCGATYAQLPLISAQSFSDTSYATYIRRKASAFAFSYLAGAGLKYKFKRKVYFLFDLNYFGAAQFTFKNVQEGITATNEGINVPGIYSFANSVGPIVDDIRTGTVKQSIGSVIVNFGIELRL